MFYHIFGLYYVLVYIIFLSFKTETLYLFKVNYLLFIICSKTPLYMPFKIFTFA